MPRVVQLGLMIALAAGAGFGQRPGGIPLGNPLPPVSPIPPFGGSARPQFSQPRAAQRGLRGPALYSLPYYPAAAYSYPAESSPGGVTIIQQFAAPPAPAAAEQPAVTPQIHEYPAPAAPSSESAPATFAIVLKNGSTLSATAVTVQDSALQIVDPDGEHRRVPLDSIDREATRRRNAERNLRLQLQ
jgi:hypothetical protein